MSSCLLFATPLAHRHARILRTLPVDHTIFCFRYPDFHHGLLGSQVVTMMQTAESWERYDLGATIWLRAWSVMGRVFFQFQMRSVEMVIADVF